MQEPAPPVPPPKPSSHEPSRINTPVATGSQSPRPGSGFDPASTTSGSLLSRATQGDPVQQYYTPDPGDQWLPQILQDKSKQDLAAILASPELLNALTYSPDTTHDSLSESRHGLQDALAENLDMAAQLVEMEARLSHQRSTTQAQLLSTHALERQWRQKQSNMDHALAPFSPSSLYQRLSQGVQEQALVCHAMEESFLEGEVDGSVASEREVLDWARRYKDSKALFYLRQERKSRWDEGRVGGWR